MSEEKNFNGNVYDIIDLYMKYKNDHSKSIEKENESQFDNHRDIDQEEKGKNNNEKLSELPIHQLLKNLDLTDLMMDYDAVSLYASAMSDTESIYPGIDAGYAYTPDMNDDFVKKFM